MPDFCESFDILNKSTILNRAHVNRVFFDPSLETHLESFRHFLRTGNWGNVQFYCEQPYTDVPMTVLMKYAMYEENTTRETHAERTARYTSMNLIRAAASAPSNRA